MTVLGIDTSSGRSGVTVLAAAEVEGAVEAGDTDHSRRLLPMIVETLERAGVDSGLSSDSQGSGRDSARGSQDNPRLSVGSL